MDKNILVTGGAGYIGSHVVYYLISKGISPKNIIIFDNLINGNSQNIHPEVTFVKGDLLVKRDVETLFNNHSFDSVIHFAAYAYVGESVQNPHKYFENNVQGGLNLLDQMVKHSVKKIVFSSTCAVYGNPSGERIHENDKKVPTNPYGESKLMFEKILKWYDQIFGIKSFILRYFNAAGAGFGLSERHNPESHLIPLVIQAALGKKESIRVFGKDYQTPDGTCIRDYVHVLDLADAHFKALNYLENNKSSEEINLGTGNGTSVMEIINIVKKITGKDFRVDVTERRDGDPPILVADNAKAGKVLGWNGTIAIEDTIKSAIDSAV